MTSQCWQEFLEMTSQCWQAPLTMTSQCLVPMFLATSRAMRKQLNNDSAGTMQVNLAQRQFLAEANKTQLSRDIEENARYSSREEIQIRSTQHMYGPKTSSSHCLRLDSTGWKKKKRTTEENMGGDLAGGPAEKRNQLD